jgi:predicted RNase H-like HicB family nuclease
MRWNDWLRQPAAFLQSGGGCVKLIVTLERDETGTTVAQCPAIPGCVSQGRTEEEALANIREAIQACIEARVEAGMPLTVATREIEVAV